MFDTKQYLTPQNFQYTVLLDRLKIQLQISVYFVQRKLINLQLVMKPLQTVFQTKLHQG